MLATSQDRLHVAFLVTLCLIVLGCEIAKSADRSFEADAAVPNKQRDTRPRSPLPVRWQIPSH